MDKRMVRRTDDRVDTSLTAGIDEVRILKPLQRTKARWLVGGLALGVVVGAWAGGGPERYGEPEGFLGGLRGACRTLAKSCRYAEAMAWDCLHQQPSSVRRLGLTRQVETRLWQDKRLDAEGIVVEVGDDGSAVLKGLVPDEDHKDKAVALARDTRGVERVVDQLAVLPESRTIETTPAPAVPTGVAMGTRVMR